MSRMQTRSMKQQQQSSPALIQRRIVTRSQTREHYEQSINKIKMLHDKEAWFRLYVKKTLQMVNDVKNNYTNEKDIIWERTRLVDELYYNIDNYIGELLVNDPYNWKLFARVVIGNANALIDQITNIKNDEYLVFTHEEYKYLRQVIKQIKKTKQTIITKL
jgi:hypothetical protein